MSCGGNRARKSQRVNAKLSLLLGIYCNLDFLTFNTSNLNLTNLWELVELILQIIGKTHERCRILACCQKSPYRYVFKIKFSNFRSHDILGKSGYRIDRRLHALLSAVWVKARIEFNKNS